MANLNSMNTQILTVSPSFPAPRSALRIEMLPASVVNLSNPTHTRNLNLRFPPRSKIVNRTSSIENRLALTPWSQPTAKVAHCRFSKIRPETYTLNLNTRNAGLETGSLRGLLAWSLSLNTLAFLPPDHRPGLAPVAPGILQRTPGNACNHATHAPHVSALSVSPVLKSA